MPLYMPLAGLKPLFWTFGGASGFIPLKLFISAKSPKKIAGGTGIIFKFNSDLLKQGVDLKFEFLNQ